MTNDRRRRQAVRGQKEIARLQAEGVRDSELERLLSPGTRAYRLPDDRELTVLVDGTGSLWASREAVLEMFRELAAEPEVTHVLQGYGFDERFPASVPELVGRLREEVAKGLALPPGTVVETRFLGRFIRKRGARWALRPGVFERVVAWVGHELVARHGGHWRMIHHDDCGVWEPILELTGNEEHGIAVELWDEIRANGKNARLDIVGL